MGYIENAAFRKFWRELPVLVDQESGLYLAQHAVDAAERRSGTIRTMFAESGRSHRPDRLGQFRDAVHRAIHEAALETAGLGPKARSAARAADPRRRADAGQRIGLITLRTQATTDAVSWRAGLDAVAPGIVKNVDQLPACEPRSLLHAAATSELIEQLTDEPSEAFDRMIDPEGGWDAAARLAGARPEHVGQVADVMRDAYARVDDIELTGKPADGSRNQLSRFEGEVRRAQEIGRRAAVTGRTAAAELAERAEAAPARQPLIDSRTGLVDPARPAAEAPPAESPGPTSYGQGRDSVDRSW